MDRKGLMDNKNGIVFGVADKKSIAWAISKRLYQEGAHIIISYQNKRFETIIRKLTKTLGDKVGTVACDVSNEEDIQKARQHCINQIGKIDFIVHSLAFAPRQEFEGRFLDTSGEGFKMAQEISAYSLTAILRHFEKDLKEGASVVTMTFQGAQRIFPGYNVMGPAKASLEASVRHLAYELGSRQIRVNAISAGPLATSAANWIPGFQFMLEHHGQISALKRNITHEEVANAAVFLLSDLASGITGEVLYVDAGYRIVAP
jgi:enoyl-[acyl-carrier protein] reductase I